MNEISEINHCSTEKRGTVSHDFKNHLETVPFVIQGSGEIRALLLTAAEVEAQISKVACHTFI